MKTPVTVSVNGKPLTITSRFKRVVRGFPNTRDELLHCRFQVTIRNTRKVRRGFPFFDSYSNYKKGIRELDETVTLYTLRLFLEDAIAGALPYADFCSDFGYDASETPSKKIYRELQKQRARAHALGLTDNDLEKGIQELTARGIE